jgi:hypothetical protein
MNGHTVTEDKCDVTKDNFYEKLVVLGGLMVIVFAIKSNVREFKPCRGQWINCQPNVIKN